MACYHPVRAWRARNGTVTMGKEKPDTEGLQVPCGKCMGCRATRSQGWALRCQLELKQHKAATFVTLTYDPKYVPPTLRKEHLSDFLKRLRERLTRQTPDRTIRFFGCGEYGEKATRRPHYHVIIYGTSKADTEIIQKAWTQGFARVDQATPASISYVAGYVDKKYSKPNEPTELKGTLHVDEHGEEYEYQPPFLQMSRRPGIGGLARTENRESWKEIAIHNGKTIPVPRFLHEAWKNTASKEEIEQVEDRKYEKRKTIVKTKYQREAEEQIAIKKMELRASKRTKAE